MVLVADPPQVWGMVKLKAHYDGWSEQRIKDELAARVGLTFSRGQRVAVDLSDVRAIDAQLEAEAAARRNGLHVVNRRGYATADQQIMVGQMVYNRGDPATARELIAQVLQPGGRARSRRDTTAVKKGRC
jgi:hypothetical protein